MLESNRDVRRKKGGSWDQSFGALKKVEIMSVTTGRKLARVRPAKTGVRLRRSLLPRKHPREEDEESEDDTQHEDDELVRELRKLARVQAVRQKKEMQKLRAVIRANRSRRGLSLVFRFPAAPQARAVQATNSSCLRDDGALPWPWRGCGVAPSPPILPTLPTPKPVNVPP